LRRKCLAKHENFYEYLTCTDSFSVNVEPRIMHTAHAPLGARQDIYEYSVIALREAVINAVTHRDYLSDLLSHMQ
jgi:predicted HTH transcriptional regulator